MTLRKVNCQTAFHIQLVEVHHCRRAPPTEESFWPAASQHTLGLLTSSACCSHSMKTDAVGSNSGLEGGSWGLGGLLVSSHVPGGMFGIPKLPG